MQTQLTVPVRSGYDFGVGANLLSGAPMNKPVMSNQIDSIPHAEGATVQFVVQRCQTTHELEQSLNIDAEASYGSASFGAGISDRFKFVKNSKIQASSLFMTIVATVKLKTLSINAPTLTPEAGKLVDRPDIFAQRFGNVFVRSLERGGIFVGVLRVDTSTSAESEQIDNELKGSYGAFSADSKVKFSEAVSNSRADVFVQMYHEGGPEDLEIKDITDPGELLRNANLFLSSFRTNPDDVAVPYEMTLAPISIATGPLPPNAALLGPAQDVMRFCTTRRSALLDQLNFLQMIVDSPSRYDFSNGSSLKEIATAAADTQTDLDLISSCWSAAIDSPGTAKFPKDFVGAQAFPLAVMPAVLPQRKPPPEADSLAERGLTLARQDPLALTIRDSLPKLVQHGFDLGMAIAEGQTLLGPGKTKFINELPTPDEQRGCELAVDFSVDRNRNSTLARAGLAVAQAIPAVQQARDAEAPGLFTLGFDIGTGVFGDPQGTGALGHTADGPGAQKILAGLTPGAQRGYAVARDLSLGPPPLRA